MLDLPDTDFKAVIIYLSKELKKTLLKELKYNDSRASLVAQQVKNLPAMQETPVWFLGQEAPLEKDRLPTPVFLSFPYSSDGKESTCNVGDLGLIPGMWRSPGEGHGNPLQYSCLEDPHGERSLGATVYGVAKSQTQLND